MRRPLHLLAGCCVTALSLILTACEPAKPVATGPVEVPSDPLGVPADEQAGAASTNSESEPTMKMTKEPFGRTAAGQEVDLYTLTNANGMRVKIMSYGAIVVSVEVPDRDGNVANVNLGFDNLEMYLKGHPYFGATIGRYGNRIAKGKFTLDGKEYTLAVNNGPNHLHGGLKGFDKVVWKVAAGTVDDEQQAAHLILHHSSPDGDEGYPGKFDVTVIYTLTDENALQIHYLAKTDKPTVFSLTNHCYWNLAGAGNGDVLKQELTLNCDKYLPIDATQIPRGEERDVTGTPMDFRKSTAIGARIAQVEGGGYDHCYVINGYDGKSPQLAARVVDPASGRVMEITTTEPGIQLYTGNGLGDDAGSAHAGKHGAFCLETQHYPDSPNQPKFPSVVLKPGEKYESTTVHRFSVQK
ncbi:MAG: aldose epimerase family protein [Planctomycetia bacterium]|nr:aldose epimerase family protein [Planctomycetia bacterium]